MRQFKVNHPAYGKVGDIVSENTLNMPAMPRLLEKKRYIEVTPKTAPSVPVAPVEVPAEPTLTADAPDAPVVELSESEPEAA